MQNISKTFKIKISVSIIWAVLTLLFSGVIAGEGYSGFNFGTFLACSVFFNLPSLFYWLGFWIWGDGYIFKTVGWLFKFLKIKKIVGVIIAFLAAGVVVSVLRLLGEVLEGSFSGSDRTQRNLEAIGNLFLLFLMFWIGIKIYNKWIGKDESLDTKNILLEKDTRRPVWQAAFVFSLFVVTFLWLTVEVYGFSSDGLVSMIGEVIGGFVGAYILIALINKFSKSPIQPKNRQYVAAFLVMITLFCSNLPKIPDARDAMDFVIEIKKATSSDDVLQIVYASKTKIGRNIAPVLKEAQEISKVLADLDDERLSEVLSPETLRNPERIKKLLEIVKQKKTLAEQAPFKIERIYQSVFSKKEGLSSKMPDSMQSFWDGFLKSYNEQNIVSAVNRVLMQSQMNPLLLSITVMLWIAIMITYQES